MAAEVQRAYTLDSEALKLNTYRLLCMFYANKEIARLSNPEAPDDAASQLERGFFSREMTHLLLNIAIGLRVLDDQMVALASNNPTRQSYFVRRDRINRLHQCMMFDKMSLREVCNKVIHAVVVEPHSTEGSASHKIDDYNWLAWSDVHDESPEDAGSEPDPIKWGHLSGHIRLGGRLGKDQWWHLLEVPEFVEAIWDLLDTRG